MHGWFSVQILKLSPKITHETFEMAVSRKWLMLETWFLRFVTGILWAWIVQVQITWGNIAHPLPQKCPIMHFFQCSKVQKAINSILVVVVNFISGLLNNTNNKENNSKSEKGRSDKTIYVETWPNKKIVGKWFEKNAWSLHLIKLKYVVFFKINKQIYTIKSHATMSAELLNLACYRV